MQKENGYRMLLACLIALQILCWTLVPLWTLPNAPLDVIEGAIWGHQFEWGYHKGPPLFAWLIGLSGNLLPGSLLPILLFSQLSIAAAYWAIARLARRLMSPRDAFIAVLVTSVIYYLGYPSPEFNPIILQMAFSALAISFFFTAATEDRIQDWAIFGAAAGLGVLSRYSVTIHLLAIAAFAIGTPEIRRQWRTPGPYLAIAVGMGVVLPHLAWLVSTDFISLKYIDSRSAYTAGAYRLLEPLRFIAAQLLAALPAMVLLGLAAFSGRPGQERGAAPDADRVLQARRYLLLLGIVPIPFVAALAILSGRALRDMWGAPLWIAAPLLGVLLLRQRISDRGFRRLAMVWPVLYAAPLVIFAISMIYGPAILHRNKRVSFPGEALALEITTRFRQQTGHPLRYVVGDLWLAGNITFYSPDQPQSFTEGDVARAPWIDLAQLRHCGAVVVWQPALTAGRMPEIYTQLFPQTLDQPRIALPTPRHALQDARFTIDWAIVTPKSGRIKGEDERECLEIPTRRTESQP